MKEKITATGTVHLKIYDADGKLLSEETKKNLIVNVGKQRMCLLLANTAPSGVTEIAAGTNGTATSVTDTAITGAMVPATSGGITGITYPTETSVMFAFTFGVGDANGITIQEFGLLTADAVLWSRVTWAAIVKTSAISIVGTWEIDF